MQKIDKKKQENLVKIVTISMYHYYTTELNFGICINFLHQSETVFPESLQSGDAVF